MLLNVLYWVIMILGILMALIGAYEYSRFRKSLNTHLQNKRKKKDEIYLLINIMLGVFYFILGLFLIVKLIPGQYAFLYSILILLLEKIAKYIVKIKYGKKNK